LNRGRRGHVKRFSTRQVARRQAGGDEQIPIERLVHICESASLSRVLRSYGYFLQRMQDEKIREHLSSLDSSNAVDAVFRDLKNESHLFTRDLLTTFEQTFHSTHPIRRAVIF
jgi:hypothetical protein